MKSFPQHNILHVIGSLCAISLILESCSSGQVVANTQTVSPFSAPPATPTATPITTLTLNPNNQATRTALTALVATMDEIVKSEMTKMPNCGSPLERFYSPDGNWAAVICVEYATGVYGINDSSKVWFFKFHDVYGLKYQNDNPFGRLVPKHWSVDGKYLYIAPFTSGDGGCVLYEDGHALYRLNLNTGELTTTLAPREGYSMYSFSFSGSDEFLGYFESWQERPILKIRNMNSHNEENIPLNETFSEAGNIVWSQDNKQVIFSARSGGECDELMYYLVKVDLKSRETEILLKGIAAKYIPIRWVDDNHLLVEKVFSEEYYGVQYSLDLTTGNITQFTTPTPTIKP